MYIEKYNFGNMTIDDKRYTNDVLIYSSGAVKDNWWRAAGHELRISDLPDFSEDKPDIFIMGMGYSGLLKVLPDTKRYFKDHNIKLYARETSEAVRLFNRFQKEGEEVMAGFHLTC